MKVLFISSGNSKIGVSPIIHNQGKSLIALGINVDYFTIQGKGLLCYLSNIPKLRRHLRNYHYNVIHAHYSLSAFVASIAGAKPLVVSLMGSDVKAKKWLKFIIWIFYKFSWRNTIVKSEDMKDSLGFKEVHVIPNGVDLEKFRQLSQNECKIQLGWDLDKIHLLFAAKPNRHEKNFKLTKNAFDQLYKSKTNIELHFLIDVPNNQMPIYLNAADVVVLSSLWEGSPNVIKEAMACNRPIVSTKVGDIEWLFGDIEGHFIAGLDFNDFSLKLQMAIDYSKMHTSTKGRDRIFYLGIDSESVAKSLIDLYSKLNNESTN